MDKTTIFSFATESANPIYVQKGDVTFSIFPQPAVQTMVDGAQWCLNGVITDAPYISAAVKRIFLDFTIVKVFSDIDVNFADKTTEEVYAAYDAITSMGIIEEIMSKANKKSIAFLVSSVEDTLSDIVNYRRSVAGVIDAVAAEAKVNEATMKEAEEIMSDPQKIQGVKRLLEAMDKTSQPQ